MQLLVDEAYLALERLSGGRHLTAAAMEHAVVSYGRTLRMPSDDLFVSDIVPLAAHPATSWSVVLPLFSLEEGASDLSLELGIERLDDGIFRVEIEGLHVR
jgi:hypothetical protein